MPAVMLDETGHRGATEYEFELLAEYFGISEWAIQAAEQAATDRLQRMHSSAKAEIDNFRGR
jgi:hypothetical protein